MDLDYNDEQKMLKQGAREFFEKESSGIMEENGPTGLAGTDLP